MIQLIDKTPWIGYKKKIQLINCTSCDSNVYVLCEYLLTNKNKVI